MRYAFDQKPNTTFSEDSLPNIEYLSSQSYACVIGPNNSGKSFLLKKVKEKLKGK